MRLQEIENETGIAGDDNFRKISATVEIERDNILAHIDNATNGIEKALEEGSLQLLKISHRIVTLEIEKHTAEIWKTLLNHGDNTLFPLVSFVKGELQRLARQLMGAGNLHQDEVSKLRDRTNWEQNYDLFHCMQRAGILTDEDEFFFDLIEHVDWK